MPSHEPSYGNLSISSIKCLPNSYDEKYKRRFSEAIVMCDIIREMALNGEHCTADSKSSIQPNAACPQSENRIYSPENVWSDGYSGYNCSERLAIMLISYFLLIIIGSFVLWIIDTIYRRRRTQQVPLLNQRHGD